MLWLDMLGMKVKNGIRKFFTNEEGDTNVIAIILLIVVVIGVVIIFRKNIEKLVNDIWTNIFKGAADAQESLHSN